MSDWYRYVNYKFTTLVPYSYRAGILKVGRIRRLDGSLFMFDDVYVEALVNV